jgi:hypothetical protein
MYDSTFKFPVQFIYETEKNEISPPLKGWYYNVKYYFYPIKSQVKENIGIKWMLSD